MKKLIGLLLGGFVIYKLRNVFKVLFLILIFMLLYYLNGIL